MFKVPVHRKTKRELDMAINDLKDRGFRVLVIKENPHHSTQFKRESYNKFSFSHSTESTSWYALMVKESEKDDSPLVSRTKSKDV